MNQKKIVIIDDDRSLLNMIAEILKEEGYTVESFSSTFFTDVLEPLNADLFILDVWFEDFDQGLTLAQALRNKSKLKNIPLLLMSSDPEVEKYAQKVRATQWLQKPLDFGQFLDTVATLVSD